MTATAAPGVSGEFHCLENLVDAAGGILLRDSEGSGDQEEGERTSTRELLFPLTIPSRGMFELF
jgi:hypothetical protein